MPHLRARIMPDGRRMLNVGCGTRMHYEWVNLDFSIYARLVRWPRLASALHAVGVISDERAKRLGSVDPQIVCWDVRRGLPFASETFDVVYHSHVLEHIPRTATDSFLSECRRVLKMGGVIRVVVPDLQLWAQLYSESLDRLLRPTLAREIEDHEKVIALLLDQFTRTHSTGTTQQKRWVRLLERLLRGGPDTLGELHRWMYDRFTLARLLSLTGFREVQVASALSSRIAGWSGFLLDSNPDGSTYKPESLYVEALK